MVSAHNDLGAPEIWLKFLDCIHHHKHLLLSGGIVLLSLVKCLTSIIDDIRLLVSLLPQNHSNGMVTSIKHNLKRKAPIGRLDDWGCDDSVFYPVKRFKRLINKNKWDIFGQKQSERLSSFGEILGETAVETRVSK